MRSSARHLIRDGLLVDGTGGPPVRGDLLIADGRIDALGDLGDVPDAIELDARGKAIAPGFVDIHSHADFSLLAFPGAESAVMQGITTVIAGNCGLGVAPTGPGCDFRRVAVHASDAWGVEARWSTFGEYLDQVPATAISLAALVPHGAIRNAVMGIEARAATRAELARMRELVAQAMDAGAVGLSSGLEYIPGSFADVEEIAALAQVAAERGGMYATHMRERGDRFAGAVTEAIEVARRTGIRLQLSHAAPRPYAPPHEVEAAFAAIEAARADGLDVEVDTFPEVWGPASLLDLFPRELLADDVDQVLRSLADPRGRELVERHFAAADSFLVRVAGYEQLYLASSPHHPEWSGRALPDLAAETGTPLWRLCTDMLLEAGSQLTEVTMRHVYATEDALRRVMLLPYCSLGSDGPVLTGEGEDCPSPCSASTYGYAARTLEHYVREVGMYTLQDAVRRLAALPARMAGLTDRGVLREGAIADVVVFDPARVADRTRPEDPARYASGFAWVFVGGEPVVRDGAPTGARPAGAVRSR